MKTCNHCGYNLASDGECYELTCPSNDIQPWEQDMINQCDAHATMDILLADNFE